MAAAVTQVTVDNTGGDTVASLQTSHEVPTGSNRVYALVGVRGEPTTITATYDEQAMASVGAVIDAGEMKVQAFVLAAPPTGSHTGEVSVDPDRRFTVFWVSVENAAGERAVETSSGQHLQTHSVTPASEPGDVVLQSTQWQASGLSISNQTGTGFDDQGVNGQNSRGAFSHAPASDPGTSTEMEVTWDSEPGTGASHAMLGFAIIAAPDPPDAPTDFQTTEEAAHHIDVGWTDQTDGAHPHRLYLRETGEQWEIAGEAPAGETTFRYGFLETATSYELGITSFDGDLESEMVTTTGATETPETPEVGPKGVLYWIEGIGEFAADAPPGTPIVSLSEKTHVRITVALTAGAGATSHKLFRHTATMAGDPTNGTEIGTYGSTVPPTEDDDGRTPETPYFYILRATNSEGNTDSAELEVTTEEAPDETAELTDAGVFAIFDATNPTL